MAAVTTRTESAASAADRPVRPYAGVPRAEPVERKTPTQKPAFGIPAPAGSIAAIELRLGF